MIRYLTSGESHGKGLSIIIDGVPSNISITPGFIDAILSERQKGYGRGNRQKIEKDTAEILSGVRFGKTTGNPIAIFVKNKDFENWKGMMSVAPFDGQIKEYTVPRPGHADLTGGIKYRQKDLRNILERASARETAARVIAGAIAKKALESFGIDVLGFVSSIGGAAGFEAANTDIKKVKSQMAAVEKNTSAQLRYPGKNADSLIALIDKAKKDGDTLGGVVTVLTSPLPVGLGSYIQWDKKIDAKIAMALMSIQAFKGVAFGAGFAYAQNTGSKMHDEIYYNKKLGFFRKTNNAGGIEGGMTNGNPLCVSAVMKPISTVMKGLSSADIKTKKTVKTVYERSDVCAVPAASLLAEAVVAVELFCAMQEKFGGDEINEMKLNFDNYMKYAGRY